MKNKTRVALLFIFLNLLSMGAFAKEGSKIVSLHVDGMISRTCPTLLKSAVRKIKGVKHVEVSYADHSAKIEFDDSQISLTDIQKTIKSRVGFDTEIK